MIRAGDPLWAAIRVWPLTVMMMVREVITVSGRHPDRYAARPPPNGDSGPMTIGAFCAGRALQNSRL
jgi:hypothetical protein